MKKSVEIQMEADMAARPIALFVQAANRYNSQIYLEMDGKRVNAKSIMGMMTLGLAEGESVKVTADGADEAQAIEGIEKYLSNN